MMALGTADPLAFAEELHFIRQFNRMKMLMTVHLFTLDLVSICLHSRSCLHTDVKECHESKRPEEW
jgi:serine phosphatase RsbU (regulator of sigma subunit)